MDHYLEPYATIHLTNNFRSQEEFVIVDYKRYSAYDRLIYGVVLMIVPSRYEEDWAYY